MQCKTPAVIDGAHPLVLTPHTADPRSLPFPLTGIGDGPEPVSGPFKPLEVIAWSRYRPLDSSSLVCPHFCSTFSCLSW